MIERIAWKRACQQKGEAECIAARHAEQRFNQRMDQQADQSIALANEQTVEKFRKPLIDRGLLQGVLVVQTV